MQRFGSAPLPGKTYIRRPGVYAILPRNDGILATYQAGIYNEFQLPGGGVDPGENPVQALHREVFEETGWSIAAPKLFFRFRFFTYMPEYDMWADKICSIYVARPARSWGPPLEEEHTAVWLDLASARRLVAVEGDRAALARFSKLQS